MILNEVVDTSTGNNSESDNIVPSNVDEEVAVPPVVEKDDNNDETKVKEIVAFLQQRLPVKEDKGIKRYITKQNAGADGEEES